MTDAQKTAGTDLIKQNDEIVSFVENDRLQHELRELLPPTVSRATFTRALKNALLTDESGKLLKADKVSIYQAALRCAMDGLLPDGRDAVILPYWDNKNKKNRAQYIQMIGGQRRICGEYGWALDARVVCENDEFDPDIENHRANFKRARLGTDRGEIIGAYAIAEHRDGRKIGPVVMDVKDIDRVRAKSKQPNGQLWTEWYDRACEKTVAKAVMKQIPWDSKDRERVVNFLAADENGEDDFPDIVSKLYGAAGEGDAVNGGAGSGAPSPTAHVPEPAAENDGGESVEDAEFEPLNDGEAEAPLPSSPAAPSPDTDPDGQEDAAETKAEPERPASGSATSPKRATRKRAATKKTEPKPEEELAAEPEPPDDPEQQTVEEEPRFEGMRYAGMTPSEVLAITETDSNGNAKGVEYLKWALRSWKTPTMKEFLERFAEQHPEIKA